MIYRDINDILFKWSKKANRKPLILRGARQVGKTTAVNMFSKQYEQYLFFNLEEAKDRTVFEKFADIDELVQALYFARRAKRSIKTLLFIDEIQEYPPAISILRFFHEKHPDIHVIAAGSLLESVFDKDISFPVGRVEYCVLRPISFLEFLMALGETEAIEELQSIPLNRYAHDKLLKLFHIYTLIGGMPEVVSSYTANKDLSVLSDIFEALIASYLEDIEKYARNDAMVRVIRHAIQASFGEAGNRIKFHGFGRSNYGSKEMGEALRTLGKAMLLSLNYPVTGATLPLLPDYKRSPKLQMIDTGLVNYFAGIQNEVLGSDNLDTVYQGRIAEHIVGQELLAIKFNVLSKLNFWVREKSQSVAELDFLHLHRSTIVPIEVKSGATGRLRSLHQYMDISKSNLAIRFYNGDVKIDEITSAKGKKYTLMSLPYFLVSQIDKYIEWYDEDESKNNNQ